MKATAKVARRGKMVNGFNPDNMDSLTEQTRSLVGRRAKLLGPAYRLFYANPVEVCKAQGVLLYDSAGNEYLDAYNNVVSVGHSHPRVVQAITEQLQTLCTHTRYIQQGILDYAEDLLSTFEDELAHVMFTCTGSEANDLALRVAKYQSGNQGIIVTSEAYHGNSELSASFSPSMGENSPLGLHVRRVPAPNPYRIDTDDMGRWLADKVNEQIKDLQRRGEGVAAFIADSLFSSDGVLTQPTNVLAPVADIVRQAGGVFIADEVQSGFSRSGSHMWGYQRHGIVPDIVTMGKPMGNGYPVAAVAVKPSVIESFGNDMRYFNTFGGNSVAIAAAQATLDVIRDEQLMTNAELVGKQISDGLHALAQREERIGDIRQAGLYLGVELVSDRQTREPDAETTSAVVNGLRERRVLISATGYHANVLKIRPPLVFSEVHADRLLSEIEMVFRNI